MAYDNPKVRQYDFGVIDFGAGANVVHTIQVPKFGKVSGAAGRVVDVILSEVSENFAGSTSDAGVQVGDGTDADKYYDTGLVLDEEVDVADNAILHLGDDGAKVDIEQGRDTITVTFVVSAGTPTGQAAVALVVEWF
jgi:hypothetical protein